MSYGSADNRWCCGVAVLQCCGQVEIEGIKREKGGRDHERNGEIATFFILPNNSLLKDGVPYTV
jgi:hypothetical protein